MLQLRDLFYSYQNCEFHFDLSLQQGDIVAVLGKSGSGKSTLLSLISGFIEPQKGQIKIKDQSQLGISPHLRPLAILFQEFNLFAHLTVAENIGLGLHPGLKLTSVQHQQVIEATKQVGLTDYLNRLPQQLSGGQKQRVALARCFIQNRPLWLLDEPFSALDPLLRNEMLGLVKKIAQEQNITILMVSHNIEDAQAVASHFIFIEAGKIADKGKIQDLKSTTNSLSLQQFVS